MKYFLLIVLFSVFSFSSEISHAKVVKLSRKGEKIVAALCESSKLPQAEGSIEELIEKIKASAACPALSLNKLKAVAYYLSNGSMQDHGKHIEVPTGAKCPVCGMFVSKYPKWAALVVHDGKPHYFDGVKDMMKYYIFDGNFPYDRKQIEKIEVTDYYSLNAIDAKRAYYVYDANLYGPMGRELIAFETARDAETFMQEHQGKKVVKFHEITDEMVMHLDGL